MFANSGIGSRLNAIVITINAMILVLVALIAAGSSNTSLREQALQRFSEKMNTEISSLDQVWRQIEQTATDFAAGLATVEDLARLNGLLLYVAEFAQTDQDSQFVSRFGVIRPDGSVSVMNIPNPQVPTEYVWRIYTSLRDMPTSPEIAAASDSAEPLWFRQAQAQYDPEKQAAISIAAPYTYTNADGSTHKGSVWVDVPLERIYNLVTNSANEAGLLAESTNGYAILLDQNGAPLATYNYPLVDALPVADLATQLQSRLASASLSGGMYRLTEPYREVEALMIRAYFSLNNWAFAAVLPAEEIPTLPGQIFIPIVFVSLFGILLLWFSVNTFIDRTVVRPLKNLGGAAQEIGSGDLRYQIAHQQQDDEIGVLARAMEDMKTNLAHSYDELARWSRTLEQRVTTRTKELEEARRVADVNATELRAIYDESLLVVNESQLSPVLNAFITRILTLLKCNYCAVWLLMEDKERLQLVATSDTSAFDFLTIMSRDEGLVGQTIAKGAPILLANYLEYEHRLASSHVPTGLHRAMSMPLMYVGRPIGVVTIGRPADAPEFGEQETRLLALFANLVSPSVRNAQLYVKTIEAVAEAERANQVKTRFLASVTHELRTPLNLIINNMDFMRIGAFGEVTEEQVSRLNQTIRSAEHLLYLINDLLDVSKIDAGEMQLFLQMSDVYTLLEDTIDNTYAFIEKYEEKTDKIQFRTEIEENLPDLPMDVRRVRQVLTNLLTNAVKFTAEGEVYLSVKRDPAGIRFTVRDTGMGIPPDELPKLFEAFERTNQAKAQNIEGTGLGLPISKYLVEAHGGSTLHVESAAGKGSTFWFTLPLETPKDFKPRRTDTQLLAMLTSKPTEE
jgi:signal transduction histidine kinase/methyl-accepting chemotaxis protein